MMLGVPLPTFLILGAARSGTTSLHYYLGGHPEICMSSIKEPNHFAFDRSGGAAAPLIAPDPRILAKSVPDRRRYEQLFTPEPGVRAVGEASPLYLYVKETPGIVAEELDGVRCIAVLRHPVERAYSHFLHVYRGEAQGAEEGFRAAVEAEIAHGTGYTPFKTGTHLLRLGLYAEQIERWDQAIGPDRLLLLRFEDLEADPDATLRTVCAFLGVDEGHRFDTSVVYNRSGVTRNAALRRLRATATRVQPWVKAALPARAGGALGRLRARNERPSPADELDPTLRAAVAAHTAADVDAVAQRTGWDLSAWKR